MRKIPALLALLLSAGAPAAVAAPDFGTGTSFERKATGLEAVIFEAPGCRYCEALRRDVVPSYDSSPAGKQAPLRFVDLNAPAAQHIRLTRPVSMVPTLVLTKDGVEIGRIDGYVGRQSFHRLLEAMLGSH